MRDHITRETWRAEAARQGISLVSLAKRTGITARAIYAYSSGSRQPSDAWVTRVAFVLSELEEARVA